MNVAAILKMKGKGVFTASADTSLLEIAKLLEQHGIGCIVVEGDEGKVVGIVSERDIVRAIGRSGTKVLNEPVSTYIRPTMSGSRPAMKSVMRSSTWRLLRR